MKIILFIIFFVAYIAVCNANSSNWIKTDLLQSIVKEKVVNIKGRSYFYQNPDICCKDINIFLFQNDHVLSWVSYNGYDYVYFYKKNGDLVSGWMYSSDLKDEEAIDTLPLKISDFFVISKWGKIELDSSYEHFYSRAKKDEITSDNIGFQNDNLITVGKNTYKYFQHEFQGLSLISSNINYIINRRDFDDYRITNLIITDNSIITGRGIFIGSDVSDIRLVYGEPTEKSELSWSYIIDGMSLTFYFNRFKKIERIELNIIPK
jgi:hypothetical protein